MAKKVAVENNLSIYVNTKYIPIQTLFVYLDTSKM